jgi:ubiquinone/menaquinone biosynthesis C-methylase UbiE
VLLSRIITLTASLIRGRSYYDKYEKLYSHRLMDIPSFEKLSELVKGKVLDVACGAGYLSVLFKDYVGMDVSREALRLARKHSHADFVRADAGHVPFRNGAFGTSISYDAIEHFIDPDSVVRDMRRVAPHGILALVDFSSYYRFFAYDPTHRKLFHPDEVRLLMKKHFDQVRVFRTSGTFLVPSVANTFLAKRFPNQIIVEGSG